MVRSIDCANMTFTASIRLKVVSPIDIDVIVITLLYIYIYISVVSPCENISALVHSCFVCQKFCVMRVG